MHIVKAIIVDDEPRARRVLKNILALNASVNIEIIAECSNVKEAVEKIKELKPQLVFLDVQMPKYAGYEIINFFDKIDFEIIFVTAHDQYAIKAFDICAIDYLVKPIDRGRLQEALQKLELKIQNKSNLLQYQELLKTIKNKNYNKLIIPESGNRRIVAFSDIVAIQANGSYTDIHLSNTKIITTSKNLKHYESLLEKEAYFFRSHRSWIVNINYTKSFNRTLSTLELRADLHARISRDQYSKLDFIFGNS